MRPYPITRSTVLALALLLSSSLPALAAPRTSNGGANLNPIQGSRVHARVELFDSGNAVDGLQIRGSATGLEPGTVYISLVYDAGSIPGGPDACLPSDNDNLSPEQMFVGTWVVDSAGNGSLSAIKTGSSYAPLRDIGAMSMRIAIDRSLQACGRVHTTR